MPKASWIPKKLNFTQKLDHLNGRIDRMEQQSLIPA